MIALDFEAMRLVERVGFKRLISLLDPRYKLKERGYYKTSVMPKMVSELESKIKSALQTADFFSFTTDTWSDLTSNMQLLSLTVSFVSPELELKEFVLAACPLEERHTGDYLCGLIQLIVKHGLASQQLLVELVSRCRRIVRYIDQSTNAMRRVHCLQENDNIDTPLRLLKDVPTRWDSTQRMLARILKLRPYLAQLSAEDSGVPYTLSASHYEFLQRVVGVFELFQRATKAISGADSLISIVIPVVWTLRLELLSIKETERGAGVKTLIEDLLECLQQRFEDLEQNRYTALATFLDPRFRSAAFSSADTARLCKTWLCEAPGSAAAPPSLQQQKPATDTGGGANAMHFMHLFVKQVGGPPSALVNASAVVDDASASLKKEIERYESDDRLCAFTSPLSWWAARVHEYPLLSQQARRYLSANATSISSERLFSSASQILTKRRNNLKGDTTEKLLFLRCNLEKFHR